MRQLITFHFHGKTLLVFVLLFISSFSFAQSSLPKKVQEWTTFFENEYVRIDYKYGNCDLDNQGTHKEEVYLQFTNKTSSPLSLAWQLELHYGKKCFNCNGDNNEMSFHIDLSPNQTLSGSCGDKTDQRLVIFSKHLDFESPMILSQFLIKDLERTTIH